MRTWIVAGSLLGLSMVVWGCASIVGKSAYPVAITSQPDQADISITDESGKTIFTGKTPTTVTLNTKAGYFSGKDYTVTFTKPGYAKHTAHIRRGVSGWYIAGNLVFGGLIGWLIVDPLTGAMWTLDEQTTATLSPQTSLQDSPATLQVVLLDVVPDSLRARMIKVREPVTPGSE
ncbi:MAG: hypothetical protein HOP18_07380 [Deltaproteobacteria bacterium]|nr:hypothetical protein [Deltaproteobacteria bacterium]